MAPRRGAAVLAMVASATLAPPARPADSRPPGPLCNASSVLTLLGTDTSTDRSLYALSGRAADIETWLVVVDANSESARLLPDSLGGLRSGAAHGPGPFLAAASCGSGCFQPVRLARRGWEPLGTPIRQDPASAVHLTYDRGGAPWATFHSLSEILGVLEVTAFRWNGEVWQRRGHLRLQGVGSPAAAPDPESRDSIRVGSGRFGARDEPSYWLPALPAPSGSPGGQVLGLRGAAIYLTFDSRLYTSVDGGSTWFSDTWRPWGRGGSATAGSEFWIDFPPPVDDDALAALWYDERDAADARLHLTRWHPAAGWEVPVTLPLGPGRMSVDHAVSTRSGKWLLLGPCRSVEGGATLEALAVDAGSTAARTIELVLETAWSP